MPADEPKPSGPEVVIGFVAAIGADLELLARAFRRALDSVGYDVSVVSTIEQVLSLPKWPATPETPLDVKYNVRMDAGNEFRAKLERKDAVAAIALAGIQAAREERSGDKKEPAARCAYILHSLKTPEEVELLRLTYGPNFLLAAAYVPRERRKARLATRIASSKTLVDSKAAEPDAEALIRRDEIEHGKVFGQNVQNTFPIADVFIDSSDESRANRDAERCIDLWFAHPFRTPTRDELGVFHAHGARLQSASAGRQVGAAIATKGGDLVAVGANEVAKAKGGPYWEEDSKPLDQRDHHRAVDSNSETVKTILADVLARLKKGGWFEPTRAAKPANELLAEFISAGLLGRMTVSEDDPDSLAEKALIGNLIEFMRPVHAEMAALTSAARRGVPTQDCTMFVTTFPCHECAKLIVSAGITRVVFIEPYPKSRVRDMFDDSIALDSPADGDRIPFEAFVGVAPRRYLEFFEAPERKTSDGRLVKWEDVRKKQVPRLVKDSTEVVKAEFDRLAVLTSQLQDLGLVEATE